MFSAGREKIKVVIRPLIEPVYYREDDPTGIIAGCAARLGTVLSDFLCLIFKKDETYVLLRTDIPRLGPPPIVRARSEEAANEVLWRLAHDTLLLNAWGNIVKGAGVLFYED